MNEAISQTRSTAGRSEFWTPAMTEILVKRWNGGQSGAEIMRAFAEIGIKVTRVAVVAKANRLGLASHFNHGGERKKDGKSQHAVTDRSKSGTFGTARAEEPKFAKDQSLLARPIWVVDSAGFSLVELTETMCRWPRGEAHPFNFCGQPVHVVGDKKYSYCEFHYWHAYPRAAE